MPRFDHATFIRIAPTFGKKATHPRDVMWPMPMLYGAAVADAEGCDVQVFDTWTMQLRVDTLLRKLRLWDQPLVVMDTCSSTIGAAKALARDIQEKSGAQVWMMGQHASAMPDDCMAESAVTGCLLGEPEPGLTALLRGADAADIPSHVSRGSDGAIVGDRNNGQVRDLDALPQLGTLGQLPLDAYRMRSAFVPSYQRLRWGYLLTSRGCPYACTFCSPTLRQSFGKAFRGHSPERVADDMALVERHGVGAVYVLDDIFSFDQERVVEVSDELARRGNQVQWVVQTRADFLDEPTLRAMHRAGCRGIKFGVESAVPRIQKIVRKHLSLDKVRQLKRVAEELGIALTAYYMIGNPDETREEMEETLAFAREIGAVMIQVAFNTPYPGSPYGDQLIAEGKLPDPNKLEHYDALPHNPSRVPHEELWRLHRRFYLSYYLSPRQIARYLKLRAPYNIVNRTDLELAAHGARHLVGRWRMVA